MSGHSKWSKIKRKKKAEDKKRGRVFTKLSRAITLAVKQRNSADPDTNFSLRLAIDKAKEANMPKENIKSAIDRGLGKGRDGEDLEEIVYEGFAPSKVGVLVEAFTDNSNRTVAEIKKIFEKEGGSLASPGAVSYQFQKLGLLVLKKEDNKDKQMLQIIDLGVNDVDESDDSVVVYVEPNRLAEFKKQLEKIGFEVKKMELMMQPKVLVPINKKDYSKVLKLVELLNSHDDVQKVWTNYRLKE